jgi:ATP-dependent Lhr-like helicase
LRARDVNTFVSHASLAVDERRRAEAAFAEARDCVIVATSTLELGIDVGDLDRVIQIDSPTTVASFLQRLGRTGRRPGSTRNMLFLTTGDSGALLQAAGLLQLWASGYVEPVVAPPLPLHLLAHQLLAYAIQEGRIGRHLWPEVLGRVPAYAEAISTGDAGGIVDHLVATGMLVDDGGMLSVGPEGERSYGFRHFMELTSVFTTPPTFVVRHGAHELGHLDPMSLLTNDRSYATVLLAGRSWKITSIDWNRKFAWVEPTEQHGQSRWFGSGRALSSELCDAMRDVACGTDPAGVTLTQRAAAALADLRAEFAFAEPHRTSVVIGSTSAKWWTWGGGRANASLTDALGELTTGRGDDLMIPLDHTLATMAEIRTRLAPLHPDALPTPSVAAQFAENMKFSDCLPAPLALEVARQRLVDPAGVRRVLEELQGPGYPLEDLESRRG